MYDPKYFKRFIHGQSNNGKDGQTFKGKSARRISWIYGEGKNGDFFPCLTPLIIGTKSKRWCSHHFSGLSLALNLFSSRCTKTDQLYCLAASNLQPLSPERISYKYLQIMLTNRLTFPLFVRPIPTPNSLEFFHTIWENWPALKDPLGSTFQAYCFTSSYHDLNMQESVLSENSHENLIIKPTCKHLLHLVKHPSRLPTSSTSSLHTVSFVDK